MFETLNQKLGNVLYHLSGILFIALASCMTLQILLRYLVNTSLPWMEELSRFLMVWLGFIGAAACSQRGKHIRFGMDLVGKLFNARASQYVFMLILATFNVFLFLLMVVGVQVCVQNMSVYSAAMPIPFGLVLIIIPVSTGFMFLFHSRELAALWRQRSYN